MNFLRSKNLYFQGFLQNQFILLIYHLMLFDIKIAKKDTIHLGNHNLVHGFIIVSAQFLAFEFLNFCPYYH